MKYIPLTLSLIISATLLAQDHQTIFKPLVFSQSSDIDSNFVDQSKSVTSINPNASIKDSLQRFRKFKQKSWRAAKIIFGGEAAVMAFFYIMPEDFSNWNKNFYKTPVSHWKKAFTMPPKWDDDPIMVNYIQHPLGGAIYYNGVRSQGATKLQSFLFSFAESTFFEYFIESVAERPSTQDLIVTPIAGSLIGELEHRLTLSMKRNGFNTFEKVFTFLINPMYVVFNGYKIRHPIATY
jgi:hypothetical protein